ncbi:MAG: 50S ribosomal protein L35 [Gaiellaceae bacterium]
MPKQKTSSSAKKRFKLTATGKLTRRQANLSHNLGKKSQKRKRKLAGDAPVSRAEDRKVRAQLGKK